MLQCISTCILLYVHCWLVCGAHVHVQGKFCSGASPETCPCENTTSRTQRVYLIMYLACLKDFLRGLYVFRLPTASHVKRTPRETVSKDLPSGW
ncbi:hypothetical protein GGS20DRAFT_527435 [Poronia punctata]|nr:hypothetical protein GGS20DRAFT_527435 [Poronia punctata]